MTISEILSVDLYGKPRNFMWLRVLLIVWIKDGNWRAIVLIRLIAHFHKHKRHRLCKWAANKLRREFGCFVQPTAVIGPGLKLPHPNGIIIGSGVKIGSNCTIYQQVTMGGARIGDWKADRYPDLGDDVTLFAGAKLIGAITVGDRVTVGANAVVLRDVPTGYTAAGVPAVNRPIRTALPEAAKAISNAE